MGTFYHLICPVCGSYKTENSWRKPARKMPFGRFVESLGRASLRTVKVIVNPFHKGLSLLPVKRRLLLAVRNFYDSGVITCEDIDRYLCDMIGEFNLWSREQIYEESALKGYTRSHPTTYYYPPENNNISAVPVRRVNKPWI